MMREIIIFTAQYLILFPVIAWLYVLVKAKRSERLRFIKLTILSAILAAVLVKIATTVHQDPRPFIRDGVTPYFPGSRDNGFPSDHTVISALLASIIVCFRRKLGLILLITALLIGTARVAGGVHHGQDIIGGYAIALISVGLTRLVLSKPHLSRTTTDSSNKNT